MRAQDVLGTPPFIALGMGIARVLPRGVTYWIARRFARNMARRRTNMFRTVRANIKQVVGPEVDDQELDRCAENAIAHAGRTYVDMFRAPIRARRPEHVGVELDPREWETTWNALQDGRGVVLVGPHVSNFDLAIQYLVACGFKIQTLSLADPNTGTRVVNWLRRRRGLEITPIDVGALRHAMDQLRKGGVVLTGVDRPVSPDDEPIPFFDAPARMPTGHIRLAMQTNARVIVACCMQRDDGRYVLRIAPPVEMISTGKRAADVRTNARRVLAIVEDMIRSVPDQWLMFIPVWRPEDAA
ncbi:MAG: lysophospholipid acyltransferase family protein [Anaerolineae bacterium]